MTNDLAISARDLGKQRDEVMHLFVMKRDGTGLVQLTSGTDAISGLDKIAAQYGMWPTGIALDDQYYRLVTAMFLHGSFLHIGFNMLVLWTLGPQLERILGRDHRGRREQRIGREAALGIERFERDYIPGVLARTKGVIARAAEHAQIARPSFYRLLERLRIADDKADD